MVNVSIAVRKSCEAPKIEDKFSYTLLKIFEYLTIFVIGGLAYGAIEILWRGYTHPSMLFLGGFCLIVVGILNEGIFPTTLGIIPQMILGGIVITILEFITGLIVNVWLGLNVWDYSDMPLNFMGQICLPFTIAWCFLSFVAIVVDDFIRYSLFGEPWPEYSLWTYHEEASEAS